MSIPRVVLITTYILAVLGLLFLAQTGASTDVLTVWASTFGGVAFVDGIFTYARWSEDLY